MQWNGCLRAGVFILLSSSLSACAPAEFSVSELQAEAQKGNAAAQRNLGRAYMTGDSVSPDPVEAAKWLTRAADRNDAMAQYFLAQHYTRGAVVPQDEQKALALFEKAAERGIAGAQHALGVRYTLGQGVPKDFTKAVVWYRKAARQGLADAQNSLALRYARGEGVAVDDREAVKWFRRAAEQGVQDAQLNLAQRYGTGEGVRRDLVQGYKWAAILGEPWLLKKYGKELTPAQTTQAEREAAAFVPRIELAADEPPRSNALFWMIGCLTFVLYGTAFYVWRRSRKAGNPNPDMQSVVVSE